MISERCNRFQHLLDPGSRVRMPEYRIPHDEDTRPRLYDLGQSRGIDSSVDFNGTRKLVVINDLSSLLNLLDGIRNERLTAKPGIHAHNQQHIQQPEDVLDR